MLGWVSGLGWTRHEFEATGTTEFHQSHLSKYLMNSRTFWQKMILSNYGHQNLWYLRHVFQALSMTWFHELFCFCCCHLFVVEVDASTPCHWPCLIDAMSHRFGMAINGLWHVRAGLCLVISKWATDDHCLMTSTWATRWRLSASHIAISTLINLL